MGYECDGVRYEKLRDMRETRRARYVGLFEAGMNFTRTAHAGGGLRVRACDRRGDRGAPPRENAGVECVHTEHV